MIFLALSTTLILFISAAGVIQAILLAALLYFHPKSDRAITRFLALHILCVSIYMLMPVLQQLFTWHIIAFLVPFQFLIGPFLYLYVRSFQEQITWRKVWPHLVLFFAVGVLDIYLYLYWASTFPPSRDIPPEVLLDPKSYAQALGRNIQMLIYYLVARRTLTRYQKSIGHLFSETSKINLAWVRWLLNGFLLLIITVIALVYFAFTYPENFKLWILINTAIITPYIYLVTIKGMSQPSIWQVQPNLDKTTVEEEMKESTEVELLMTNGEKFKTASTGLNRTRIDEIVQRIVKLMEEEKLFQETELMLPQLAERLQLPAYQVSQAINEGTKRNFYDLVNSYRVMEAKRLLTDPKNENFTILSIGFEAGFNSKTTFNTVFKKFTALTPTEYRARHSSPA
jgi:AraC-like DNA-binding protein